MFDVASERLGDPAWRLFWLDGLRYGGRASQKAAFVRSLARFSMPTDSPSLLLRVKRCWCCCCRPVSRRAAGGEPG